MRLTRLAGGHTADHLGSICESLFRVESGLKKAQHQKTDERDSSRENNEPSCQ
jgi:hypothetical protein